MPNHTKWFSTMAAVIAAISFGLMLVFTKACTPDPMLVQILEEVHKEEVAEAAKPKEEQRTWWQILEDKTWESAVKVEATAKRAREKVQEYWNQTKEGGLDAAKQKAAEELKAAATAARKAAERAAYQGFLATAKLLKFKWLIQAWVNLNQDTLSKILSPQWKVIFGTLLLGLLLTLLLHLSWKDGEWKLGESTLLTLACLWDARVVVGAFERFGRPQDLWLALFVPLWWMLVWAGINYRFWAELPLAISAGCGWRYLFHWKQDDGGLLVALAEARLEEPEERRDAEQERQHRFCEACGAQNPKADRFCNRCGHRLGTPPLVADTPEPEHPDPGRRRAQPGATGSRRRRGPT